MSSDEEDDKSGSDSNQEEDDDDDNSGSSGSGSDNDSDEGSDSDDDDDDDDDDDSDDESGSENEKKKKGVTIADPAEKPGEELKNILSDMTSVEADVESFFSTLSMDTRNCIGFNPAKNRIRGAYSPPPPPPPHFNGSAGQFYPSATATSQVYRSSSPVYDQPSRIQGDNSPQMQLRNSQSQFNTYGAYRHQQKEQVSNIQPVSPPPPMPVQQRVNPVVVEEEREEVVRSGMINQQEEQIQQMQPIMEDRFKLNKESQNVIDDYYKNLYSKKQGLTNSSSSRNMTTHQQDRQRQTNSRHHKSVYDEDDLKRRSDFDGLASQKNNQDWRFFRGEGNGASGSKQKVAVQSLTRNQEKIDQAIKILLGRG